MRRQRRVYSRKFNFFYISGALLLVLSIALAVMYRIYNKNLRDISDSMLSSEQIIGLAPNELKEGNDEIESASSVLSKTIEEAKKTENEIEENEIKEELEAIPTEVEDVKPEVEEIEEKKELQFSFPVDGEVVKEFSMENLQYSATLEEWTTHQGIDIKADRTTVVKAAEAGTVKAIKNDPRFGLTVIIEHQDGYKTVYSNLLTTEFVTEDEKVEKGQTIGTVGNSAVFEIADEPHLHFEIIKDGEYVDPMKYLK